MRKVAIMRNSVAIVKIIKKIISIIDTIVKVAIMRKSNLPEINL